MCRYLVTAVQRYDFTPDWQRVSMRFVCFFLKMRLLVANPLKESASCNRHPYARTRYISRLHDFSAPSHSAYWKSISYVKITGGFGWRKQKNVYLSSIKPNIIKPNIIPSAKVTPVIVRRHHWVFEKVENVVTALKSSELLWNSRFAFIFELFLGLEEGV